MGVVTFGCPGRLYGGSSKKMYMKCDAVAQNKDWKAIEKCSGVSEDVKYVGGGKGTDFPGVTLNTLVPILTLSPLTWRI